MIKIVIYAFIGLSLGGCVVQQTPQAAMSQKSVEHTQVFTQKEPAQNASMSALNGMIRGVIMEQIFDGDKQVWIHEIKAVDAANDKLQSATFVHDKRVHDKGDLVYAIFKEGKLHEIYLIKAAYHRSPLQPVVVKKPSVTLEKKVQKRTKSRQTPWISVPKEESISLE